jgi:hypothetical protein
LEIFKSANLSSFLFTVSATFIVDDDLEDSDNCELESFTTIIREYLIDKYKYKWLENAETKENYDQTILKFFNKNKCSQYIDIRLRLKGDKISGYLKGKRTKKQEITILNIETFLIKFNLSKEEKIGRSFLNYYIMRDSEFLFSLLSASTRYF